jgi:predicted lipid-binding transport protein (Tim44 family)
VRVTDARPPQRPAGTERADAEPAMPVSVRVATGLLGVLAVLLLLSAALTWFGREGVVDRFLLAQPDLTREEVTRFVVSGLLRDLVVGLVGTAAAVWLTRRRAWARWAGVAVAAFLGLLTLMSAVGAGGTSVFSLLLVVLCVGAVTSLLARTTAAWAPMRPRGRG